MISRRGWLVALGVIVCGSTFPWRAAAQGMDDRDRWYSAAMMPRSHWLGSMVVLKDGRLMIMGGFNGAAGFFPDPSVDLYDPRTDSWSSGASMPTATLTINSAVVLRGSGEVLVFGGDIRFATTDTLQSYLYDPKTDTWAATGSLPSSAKFYSAYNMRPLVLKDGNVLAIPNISGDSGATSGLVPTSRHAFRYDPSTGRWSAASDMHVSHAETQPVLLDDGRVFMCGGRGQTTPDGQGPEISYTNTAEVYDPVADTWTFAASMPPIPGEDDVFGTAVPGNRHGHSITVLADGRVLVAGGYAAIPGVRPDPNDSTALFKRSSALTYDPATDTWTQVASCHFARASSAVFDLPGGNVAITWGDGVDLAAGMSPQDDWPTSTTEIYDPMNDTWTLGADVQRSTFAPPELHLAEAVYFTPDTESISVSDDLKATFGSFVLSDTDYQAGGLSTRLQLYVSASPSSTRRASVPLRP
jgi:N-acetylneuraminic acid mutarotase